MRAALGLSSAVGGVSAHPGSLPLPLCQTTQRLLLPRGTGALRKHLEFPWKRDGLQGGRRACAAQTPFLPLQVWSVNKEGGRVLEGSRLPGEVEGERGSRTGCASPCCTAKCRFLVLRQNRSLPREPCCLAVRLDTTPLLLQWTRSKSPASDPSLLPSPGKVQVDFYGSIYRSAGSLKLAPHAFRSTFLLY